MRLTRAACVLALAAAAAFTATPAQAAGGATWIIKGQDIAPWNNGGHQSVGLAAQAAKDGVSLPPVTYQLCGTWNGTVYGQSDYTACGPGSTLVVEDYNKLVQAISDGLFTTLGIGTALYDLESWPFTPQVPSSPRIQQANPGTWIGKAVALARTNGIRLIVSTGGNLATCSACWTAAAHDNAYMVSIQSQGWGWNKSTQSWNLPAWKTQAAAAVKTVRTARNAAGTSTLVAVGLGTNTPLVHPVSNLASEYSYMRSDSVGVFWLNANNWGSANRCTASQGGYGCPEIGVQFLERIGATG